MRKGLNIMKASISFLLLVVISACAAVAQDSTSHWRIGVAAGPDFCYRSLSVDAGMDDSKTIYDSLETPCWGKTGGIRIAYDLNPHLQLQSGLHYNTRGYNVDTLLESSIANFQFRYSRVEIPLMVRYSPADGAIRPVVRLGASINYLISADLNYERIGVNATYAMLNDDAQNKIGLNVTAALGAAFTLTDSWNVDVLLCGNQSLSPMVDAPIQRRLNALGMWFEFVWKF